MIFALPYCLAFIFILFLEFYPKQCGAVSAKYVPCLSILFFLLVFVGFRGFIVTDWVSYYPYFEENVPSFFDGDKVEKFISSWPWEKGFLLYSVAMKSICSDYFFFQFFSFLFDLTAIHITFRRYVQKKYIPLAYAVFFVFQGFVMEVNLLRNSKAIVLFMLSIPYLQNRKFLKYAALNAVGGMFHVSGFLYILLYFVLNRNFNRKFVMFIFILGNLFFFCRIKFIALLLSAIAPFLGGTRFGSMISAYGLLSDKFSSYSIGIGFLERTLTFFLLFGFQKRIEKTDRNVRAFVNLLYVFLFCYLYLSEVQILIERITMLFVIGYWIVFPVVYGELSKNRKLLFTVVLLFYGILKMLVQCDEPNYSYTNVLYEEPVYSQRYKLFNHGDKK